MSCQTDCCRVTGGQIGVRTSSSRRGNGDNIIADSQAVKQDSGVGDNEIIIAPAGPSNAPAGVSNAADGASNTADGASNTADGVPNAAHGASNTAHGASNAVDGASNAPAGASNAADGASNAADGASKAADGVNRPTAGRFSKTRHVRRARHTIFSRPSAAVRVTQAAADAEQCTRAQRLPDVESKGMCGITPSRISKAKRILSGIPRVTSKLHTRPLERVSNEDGRWNMFFTMDAVALGLARNGTSDLATMLGLPDKVRTGIATTCTPPSGVGLCAAGSRLLLQRHDVKHASFCTWF